MKLLQECKGKGTPKKLGTAISEKNHQFQAGKLVSRLAGVH
jgi:hypothetical protein